MVIYEVKINIILFNFSSPLADELVESKSYVSFHTATNSAVGLRAQYDIVPVQCEHVFYCLLFPPFEIQVFLLANNKDGEFVTSLSLCNAE